MKQKQLVWIGSFGVVLLVLIGLMSSSTQTALMQAEPDFSQKSSESQSYQITTGNKVDTAVNIQGGTALIPDGSFEDVPSLWTEDSNFPGCLPAIAEWEPITNIPAYDGTYYFRGGGACEIDEQTSFPIDNSATQLVTIPRQVPALSFRYWSHRTSPDTFEDFAYIHVDNTQVWSYPLIRANNTNGWVEQTLDLSDFAGQNVLLKLSVAHGTISDAGNMFIDYLQFVEPAAQTMVVTPVNGGGFSFTTASGKPISDLIVPPGAVDKETTIYFKHAPSPGFPLYPAPSSASPLGRSLKFAGTAFDLEAFDEFIYLPLVINNSSGTQTKQYATQLIPDLPTATEDLNSFQFGEPITIKIYYDEAKLEEIGIAEDQVYLYYWTGDGWQDAVTTCNDPSGYIRDLENNWFELNVCHFSRFGTIG